MTPRPASLLAWLPTLALLACAPGSSDPAPLDPDAHAPLTDTGAGALDVQAGDSGAGDAQAGDSGAGDAQAGDSGIEADAAEETSAPTCNHIAQTGCEEAQNCTFVAQDDTTPNCTASGELAYGAECQGTSQCELGICISISDTGYRCYKFCKTYGHCDAGKACMELVDTPYKVCELPDVYESCDLLAQDCEAATKACYPHQVSGQTKPVCLPAGAGEVGDGCANSHTDCAPGHICINHICKRLCQKSAVEPCGDAFTPCSSFYGAAGYCDD